MQWNVFCRVVLLFFVSTTVFAYDEPAVNLGLTSFMDGGPPSGPGFYFQNYLQYYSANRLNDNNGNRLPLPRTDLHVTDNVFQIIYLTTKKVLGGNLGFTAILPVVLQADIDDGLGNLVLKGQTGVGDLFIAPAIQYDPIMRKDGKTPLFVQRLDFDVLVPTGKNDNGYAVNPGGNFWAFNPYWAATLWITSKWTSSIRLHYLWNGKNNHPNVAFGPEAYISQAGQAVFANIATDYEITEKLRLGINGYFFNQFTDTKVNGVDVPNRREKVWAIGPGMLYTITKNQFLFLNLYFEQDARNRPQGTNGVLRYAIHLG
jgi:hypothetical protein